MDGVLALESFYNRGGFDEAYRNIRMEGVLPVGNAGEPIGVIALGIEDLSAVLDAETGTFPTRRSDFLERWIDRPGVRLFGIRSSSALSSFVVARPCREGFKLGPFVGSSAGEARDLLNHLGSDLHGERVQWDVPETNRVAMAMATHLGFAPSFACARLYLGHAPAIEIDRLYGVTSFEFG